VFLNVGMQGIYKYGSRNFSMRMRIAVMEHRLLAMKEKRYEANLGMRTRARAKERI